MGMPVIIIGFFQRIELHRETWLQFAAQGIHIFEPANSAAPVIEDPVKIAFLVRLFQLENQAVILLDDG